MGDSGSETRVEDNNINKNPDLLSKKVWIRLILATNWSGFDLNRQQKGP